MPSEPTKGFREACLEILGQYHDYLAYQVYDRELSESDYNAMLNSHQAISAIQDLVEQLINEERELVLDKWAAENHEKVVAIRNQLRAELRQALRDRVKSD